MSQPIEDDEFPTYVADEDEVYTASEDEEDQQVQVSEELEALRVQLAKAQAELAHTKRQAAEARKGAIQKPVSRKSEAQQKKEKLDRQYKMEQARHLKKQVDWSAAGFKGLPPHFLADIDVSIDGSKPPVDPATGESVVPDGMCPVWVSCYDLNGRDDDQPEDVALRQRFGYKIAEYEDGRDVRRSRGILMYATPEAAALWTIKHTRPNSIHPQDYYAAQMEAEAEAINVNAGQRLLNIRPIDDHGEDSRSELFKA